MVSCKESSCLAETVTDPRIKDGETYNGVWNGVSNGANYWGDQGVEALMLKAFCEHHKIFAWILHGHVF
jgi:hypothetical protein